MPPAARTTTRATSVERLPSGAATSIDLTASPAAVASMRTTVAEVTSVTFGAISAAMCRPNRVYSNGYDSAVSRLNCHWNGSSTSSSGPSPGRTRPASRQKRSSLK